MKRVAPLALAAVAALLLILALPDRPSFAGLPGRIPEKWIQRVVYLRGATADGDIILAGVLVDRVTVLTCKHWIMSGDPGMNWRVGVHRGPLPDEEIKVVGIVMVPGQDLCLFTLESAPEHAPITPLAQEEPPNGAFVVCIGHPFGMARVCTVGVYSGHRVYEPLAGLGECALVAVSSSRGNSGGPMFDANGALVGIVSASYEGSQLSLVTPLSAIKRVLKDARPGKKRD